jgi:hypothetical protein
MDRFQFAAVGVITDSYMADHFHHSLLVIIPTRAHFVAILLWPKKTATVKWPQVCGKNII